MPSLDALVFDVQGTLVDFYVPLMRLGAEINACKGLAIDWAAASVRWRALYRDAMDSIIAGTGEWRRVDDIYRDALDRLLDEMDLSARFDVAERDRISGVWSRLEAWSDSVDGLARLRRTYTLATLSNAGMAAVVAIVKRAALPFDAILTAELARSYKPAPAVYQLAVDYLGVPPERMMMVACHKYDLRAAKAFGMQTAFVARPLEFGPGGNPDIAPDLGFDIHAVDLHDLADQLGA
jgi:2-haloacid dehalogenase